MDKGVDPPNITLTPIEKDNEMPPTIEDFWDAENLLMEKVRLTKDAIYDLPLMYKGFMVERFLNKKSYNDILNLMKYQETGINMQTVKNRIFRGRKIVKKQLESMKVFTEA